MADETATAAEIAYLKYLALDRRLARTEKFLLDTPDDGKTLGILKSRYKKVFPIADDMEKLLHEIDAARLPDSDHELVENRYFALINSLEMAITAKTPVVPAPVTIDRPEFNESRLSRSHTLKAPKLEIPKFDGSYEKWPKYRDMFTSLIHNNEDFSDMLKFSYLESTFKIPAGEPNVLDNFAMSEECYGAAWKAVCDRYNDKRRLVAHHLNAILVTKKMSSYTASELLRVLDSFTSNLSALAQQGLVLDGEALSLANVMIVHLLMLRLDDEVVREWRKYNNEDFPSLKVLTEYLRVLWRSCQDLTTSQKAEKPVELKTVKRTLTVNSSEDDDATTCVLCSGSHLLWKCEKFKASEQEERWNIVKSHRLCFICLQEGHTSLACKMTQLRCKRCSGKHSGLLHYERAADKVQSMIAENSARSSTNLNGSSTNLNGSSTNLNANFPTFTPYQMARRPDVSSNGFTGVSSNVFTISKRQTLLSTISVLVKDADGRLQVCRALLDSGSDSHIMTSACAQRLKLKLTDCCQPIVGLNGKRTTIRHKAQARIESRYGPFELLLNFSVMKEVTGVLPSRDVDVQALRIPAGRFLADPQFDQSLEIDLLLNNTVFMDSLLSGNERLSSGPRMLETKFGWIVGGEVPFKSPPQQSFVCTFGVSTRDLADNIDDKLNRLGAASKVDRSFATLSTEERYKKLKPVTFRKKEATASMPLCKLSSNNPEMLPDLPASVVEQSDAANGLKNLVLNEERSEELQLEWNAFRKKLELNATRLNRHCSVDNHATIELHASDHENAQELTHRFVWRHIKGVENSTEVWARRLALEMKDRSLCSMTDWLTSRVTTKQEDPETLRERYLSCLPFEKELPLEAREGV